MAKVYYEADGDFQHLAGKTIAIIGYGSQGHAHALCLRDNGQKVIVGELPGSKAAIKAQAAGFEVVDAAAATRRGDVIALLVPDQVQAKTYKESVAPHLGKGKTLLFAHGFNINFQFIVPPAAVDVIMVAPKSPGHRMREIFTQGQGVPGIVAVYQDASGQAEQTALAYAKGIGCLRAGSIRTTFKEEVETDLFGEQVVLCGGVSALIVAAFETLVEAGYQPEIAYFECLNELKLIVDLIYEGGIKYMRYSCSDTAEYGDYTRGPVVIDAHVRATMKKILADVQNGSFAREWMEENAQGGQRFLDMRAQASEHLIEKIGTDLRKMMVWNRPGEEATAEQAEARK